MKLYRVTDLSTGISALHEDLDSAVVDIDHWGMRTTGYRLEVIELRSTDSWKVVDLGSE